MTTLPIAIKAKLDNDGVLTRNGVTRWARPNRCRSCRAATLAGLHYGFEIHACPIPITPIQEVAALLNGKHTFTVVFREMVLRDKWRIAAASADDVDVFLEHECGMRPPERNAKRAPRMKQPHEYDRPPY